MKTAPEHILRLFYNRCPRLAGKFDDFHHFFLAFGIISKRVSGGLSLLISFAKRSRGYNSSFVPEVLKKMTSGVLLFSFV